MQTESPHEDKDMEGSQKEIELSPAEERVLRVIKNSPEPLSLVKIQLALGLVSPTGIRKAIREAIYTLQEKFPGNIMTISTGQQAGRISWFDKSVVQIPLEENTRIEPASESTVMPVLEDGVNPYRDWIRNRPREKWIEEKRSGPAPTVIPEPALETYKEASDFSPPNDRPLFRFDPASSGSRALSAAEARVIMEAARKIGIDADNVSEVLGMLPESAINKILSAVDSEQIRERPQEVPVPLVIDKPAALSASPPVHGTSRPEELDVEEEELLPGQDILLELEKDVEAEVQTSEMSPFRLSREQQRMLAGALLDFNGQYELEELGVPLTRMELESLRKVTMSERIPYSEKKARELQTVLNAAVTNLKGSLAQNGNSRWILNAIQKLASDRLRGPGDVFWEIYYGMRPRPIKT